MKTTRLSPDLHCSQCGKQVDAHSSFNNHKPSPGDISVCMYCGHVARYQNNALGNLMLRDVSLVELNSLKKDKHLWKTIQQYQKACAETMEKWKKKEKA